MLNNTSPAVAAPFAAFTSGDIVTNTRTGKSYRLCSWFPDTGRARGSAVSLINPGTSLASWRWLQTGSVNFSLAHCVVAIKAVR